MNRISLQARSGRQSGFTLIEVMVGLIISASIMAGLTTLASSVNLGWGRIERKLSGLESVANGLAIASGDIARIQRIADREFVKPTFRFRGEPASMTFVIAERPASSARGLYWIHLYTRKTTTGIALVRARAPFTAKPGSFSSVSWADEVVLTEGAVSFSFSYAGMPNAPKAWLRDWPEGDILPGLVRFQVKDVMTGNEAYPPLSIALRVGAEAACADIQGAQCTMHSAGKLISEAN
jgi:general secretion pathway protein J